MSVKLAPFESPADSDAESKDVSIDYGQRSSEV